MPGKSLDISELLFDWTLVLQTDVLLHSRPMDFFISIEELPTFFLVASPLSQLKVLTERLFEPLWFTHIKCIAFGTGLVARFFPLNDTLRTEGRSTTKLAALLWIH